MSDWRIVGNERAIRALQAAVANGSPAHAYLFVGPEHTGRALAATRLAQALNCTEADPPCGECNQCRRIEAGIHPDVHTVTFDPEEGVARKNILIGQIRDELALAALTPYEGRTRVVFINPAPEMTEQAQNAFLKTLEEPPPNAAFVLIAKDTEKLLETILSRCTRLDFGFSSADEIEAGLRQRGAAPDEARLLARLSGGRPGWALDAAANPKVLERRHEVLAAGRSLASLPMADRMDLAERLSDAFKRDREAVLAQLDQWAAWWRDVLLAQSGAGDRVANLDLDNELREDAGAYSRADVAAFLQALIETRVFLVDNVQSRLALDALMLAAPRSGDRARS